MFTKTIVGEPRAAGFDATTIYDWFHDKQGPQPACSAAEAVLKQITQIHADVHGILKRGTEESRAFWTGGAADAARGGMSPMLAWADQIQQVADGAQKQVVLVRDAFDRARNSVEPPHPEPDPRKVTVGFMPFGGSGVNDFIKSTQQWQANLEHNVRVAESYAMSSSTALQAVAEFAHPVGGGGEVKPPETPPRDPSPPPISPGGGGRRGGSESASFVPTPQRGGQTGPQPWRPESGSQRARSRPAGGHQGRGRGTRAAVMVGGGRRRVLQRHAEGRAARHRRRALSVRARISAPAFDVLWQHHALGTKPPALATCPSPGRTTRERQELERLAWQELAPHGDMAPAMSLLRAPSVEYFGWFGGIDRSWSAHVAVGQQAALRVVVDRDQVTLETVPAARAAEALVAALPPMPPGSGGIFSVPERPPARDSVLVQAHRRTPS
nr:ESX secretion-associated protein EspG [Allokutzneria albata]